MNQADFWTEYSLNMPFLFGMLDLFDYHFSFFFTNIRRHFASFQNFRKSMSQTKANTLLIKTLLCFLFQSSWDAKIMVTFWLQLFDKVMFADDNTAKNVFELFI